MGNGENLYASGKQQLAAAGMKFTERELLYPDSRGNFKCDLPPGRYDITATNYNFFPYRRAAVNLVEGRDITIKIHTVPGPLRGLEVGPSQSEIFKSVSPIRYEEEKLPDGSEVVVQYHEMQERDGRVSFRGPYAALTVGGLSLYGEDLSCSTPIRTCTASGSVLVELEETELRGQSAELDLAGRTIRMGEEPEVVHRF